MHSIRLRHPWHANSEGGLTTWSRKFNWPAQLAPGETLQLVIEQAPPSAEVVLNGTPLGGSLAAPRDISALVAKHNRLSITAASGDPSATCPYEVRLEITS